MQTPVTIKSERLNAKWFYLLLDLIALKTLLISSLRKIIETDCIWYL